MAMAHTIAAHIHAITEATAMLSTPTTTMIGTLRSVMAVSPGPGPLRSLCRLTLRSRNCPITLNTRRVASTATSPDMPYATGNSERAAIRQVDKTPVLFRGGGRHSGSPSVSSTSPSPGSASSRGAGLSTVIAEGDCASSHVGSFLNDSPPLLTRKGPALCHPGCASSGGSGGTSVGMAAVWSGEETGYGIVAGGSH